MRKWRNINENEVPKFGMRILQASHFGARNECFQTAKLCSNFNLRQPTGPNLAEKLGLFPRRRLELSALFCSKKVVISFLFKKQEKEGALEN